MIKHFTASAYIATKLDGELKLLLHEHKKLNLWVGIGGHVEVNENPLEAVRREVKEETNLEVIFISASQNPPLEETEVSEVPLPVILLEELIPAHGNESEHIHIDHIYAAFTKNPQHIKMSETYKWFSQSEINSLEGKTANQIRVISQRVFELIKRHPEFISGSKDSETSSE